MSKRAPAGFTLIELLVVIAIMAVLAAIMLPGYLSVERSQKLNGCMNHLRAIGVALAMYHEDYGSYPPAPAPEYLRSGGSDATYLPFSSDVGISYTGTSAHDTPPGRLDKDDSDYSGPPMKFIVKIDSVGTPDTFCWSTDDGATWSTSMDIPTSVPPDPLGTTNVKVTFGAETGHAGDEQWTFWVGVSRVGQYGLAMLYWEYLSDAHDYVRSRNLYHCPAMTETEQVNLRGNLEALWSQDPANQTLRKFDPLWAGYNTYDVTYNYDQFASGIAQYDAALGFGNQHANRTLATARPPADTVVCWCYAHTSGRSPSVPDAEAGEPDVVGDLAAARSAMRARRNDASLVLWVDGTVDAVRPYLTRARDDKDGQPAYYWTPPYLYSPQGGVR
ncbi:MAG TPA: type II secretion system protein [Armatimonadota bacterium]|nr:type II secretion system protein [Armatimonadota bacterium]HOS44210.1 type II secretion system protein [Armatimonadota bacterium]